jgi:hypothetical protein
MEDRGLPPLEPTVVVYFGLLRRHLSLRHYWSSGCLLPPHGRLCIPTTADHARGQRAWATCDAR